MLRPLLPMLVGATALLSAADVPVPTAAAPAVAATATHAVAAKPDPTLPMDAPTEGERAAGRRVAAGLPPTDEHVYVRPPTSDEAAASAAAAAPAAAKRNANAAATPTEAKTAATAASTDGAPAAPPAAPVDRMAGVDLAAPPIAR